jgi:transposase
MPDNQREVIGGVDTHADTHTAAVIDSTGRTLGTQQFTADLKGFRALLSWMRGFGVIRVVGIEGTGSYGVGLFQHLHDKGVEVLEVDRANRKMRRQRGKSDTVDAEAAARAVLAGTATTIPKTRSGVVEALRAIKTARASAVRSHVAAKNALLGMTRTAPEPLRSQLAGLTGSRLVKAAAALRPGFDMTDPITGTKLALRRLARRCQHLALEIREADVDLELILRDAAPVLLDQFGVGPVTAAALLIAAGDNPERIHSEQAFAMLCGAAPISASSGRTDRHRLNRGGNRQANQALHTIAVSRWDKDPRTKAYVDRRTAQGLGKRDILRCLKRYVAREMFTHVQAALRNRPLPTPPVTAPDPLVLPAA